MPDKAAPMTTTRRGRKTQRIPYQEFYAAIGRFVLTWAGLEICLDLLLLTVIPDGERAKRKLPHQLGDKIALIRSEIKRLTHARQTAITEVLDEISSYADSRHDFVHGGSIHHLIEQGVMTVTLARLLQPSRRPRRTPVKVTPPQIEVISDRIHHLGDRLLDFAEDALLTNRTVISQADPELLDLAEAVISQAYPEKKKSR
jgi:hypothetical protein